MKEQTLVDHEAEDFEGTIDHATADEAAHEGGVGGGERGDLVLDNGLPDLNGSLEATSTGAKIEKHRESSSIRLGVVLVKQSETLKGRVDPGTC